MEPAFSVVEVACGHATQPDVFNTRKPEEYLPAAQLTHTSELWPRADPDEAYVPGPHSSQLVCPDRKANVPASHSAHTPPEVAPTALEYLPALQ